jgi:PAS domain S-box-containing protein
MTKPSETGMEKPRAAHAENANMKKGTERADLAMRQPAIALAVTLAAVTAAGAIRWLMDPILQDELPFFSFYFSMVVAAWYGGFWPGILSLMLGTASGFFFFAEPRYSLEFNDSQLILHAFRFIGVGLAVSVICEGLIRSRLRSELRRELLQVTLSSIGDAVITTDTEGRVTLLNGVAEKLTGWRNEEAASRPLEKIFDIINEYSREPVENPVTKALREGVIVGLANHTLLIAKDKTERPIDDSAAPIRSKEGVILGCVLVFRDITERKNLENELRQIAADLSEADRRKDEFLATLAHELRNPLAPIRNGLQVLRMADVQPEMAAQARSMMERQLVGLVRLVDDLMDVSRITRGKVELRKARVALAAVVNSAVESSRPFIEEASHELSIAMPQQRIVVNADLTRLAQVFTNLLNNAAKYSERGGHIWLQAERQGSDVVVSVRDTGIGIAADQLPRIFDMFTQFDRSSEKSQGGLGIGLTLVKRLVEMHDGSIEARSGGPGMGSEFVVRLPVVVDSAGTLPEDDQEETMAPRSTLRILIVDDNRDGADSLAMMLKMMGNETRTAYDGQEGVEVCEAFRPDVVLLDIGLPKLNGYEACRRIRALPNGKKIILIAVTGWGQDDDRRRSHNAGFDHHLVKPVESQSLMQMLAGLNEAKQGGISTPSIRT